MRYAILEHQVAGSIHWDLLLARPYGGLRTWSLVKCPPDRCWRDARRLPDHRECYLTYQGPILPMRGWVWRWDAGAYRVVADEEGLLRVILNGTRTNGVLELRRADESGPWRYRLQLALGPKSARE